MDELELRASCDCSWTPSEPPAKSPVVLERCLGNGWTQPFHYYYYCMYMVDHSDRLPLAEAA